ncbi:hypothetical protein KM043_007506 [Ampulex compressa]|nr:hypothetical protein KM043_007506 [Ampulex compressa]
MHRYLSRYKNLPSNSSSSKTTPDTRRFFQSYPQSAEIPRVSRQSAGLFSRGTSCRWDIKPSLEKLSSKR